MKTSLIISTYNWHEALELVLISLVDSFHFRLILLCNLAHQNIFNLNFA